jgi:hypothetical protein
VDSPGNLTMRLPWQDWRPTLTGVPDGSEEGTYKEYKYFKRDVVKTAVDEVNTITHIDVELIEHKIGRSVSELQFRVRHKKQGGLEFEEENLFDLSLIARLTALGFTQGQAEKLYSDTDEPRLRGTLDYVEKRLKKGGEPIDSPMAYFRHALQKGYGVVPEGQRVAEVRKALETPKKAKPLSAEKLKEQLATAWWNETRQAARDAFDTAAEPEQLSRLKAFEEANVLPVMLKKKWQSDRLRNPMCSAAFNKWLVRDKVEPSEPELLQYGLVNGLLTAAS